MYRCYGCDTPAQMGCAAWCAKFSEVNDPPPWPWPGSVESSEQQETPAAKKINIASGEDVCLWLEEMELT